MKPRQLAPLALGGLLLSTAGCFEAPPIDAVQTGYRGLGFEHIENPRMVSDSVAAIQARIPGDVPQPLPAGDPVEGIYQNLQVLGHLSPGEITVTMLALTAWVSPEEGCNYCHVVTPDSVNYASDAIYTKVVSRQMLRMVQEINNDWSSHVGEGVNCWTCHQGQPVPTNYWYFTDENQTLRHYLDRDDIRVQGPYALTSEGENRRSIKQTEYAYALMMDMSNAMGVNCTYCHTSSRFADWTESSPQRVTALRGLRMTREANLNHLVGLQNEWPAERLGPLGDGPKLECATCHNGAYKPQYDHPAMRPTGWRALTEIGRPQSDLQPMQGAQGGGP